MTSDISLFTTTITCEVQIFVSFLFILQSTISHRQLLYMKYNFGVFYGFSETKIQQFCPYKILTEISPISASFWPPGFLPRRESRQDSHLPRRESHQGENLGGQKLAEISENLGKNESQRPKTRQDLAEILTYLSKNLAELISRWPISC